MTARGNYRRTLTHRTEPPPVYLPPPEFAAAQVGVRLGLPVIRHADADYLLVDGWPVRIQVADNRLGTRIVTWLRRLGVMPALKETACSSPSHSPSHSSPGAESEPSPDPSCEDGDLPDFLLHASGEVGADEHAQLERAQAAAVAAALDGAEVFV